MTAAASAPGKQILVADFLNVHVFLVVGDSFPSDFIYLKNLRKFIESQFVQSPPSSLLARTETGSPVCISPFNICIGYFSSRSLEGHMTI